MNKFAVRASLVGALALVAGAALADTTQRIRGTVTSVSGNTLMIKSVTGDALTVKLADDWKASGIVKASMDDIKPGVFVGTASTAKESDIDDLTALELVVFPEAMRGTGEGHTPWDLKPGSTMTNATVTSKVESVKGQTLTLTYKGGEKKVVLPKDVPIVTIAPAEQSDVKAGASVFIPAQKKDDGSLVATRILVGKDGIVPPM